MSTFFTFLVSLLIGFAVCLIACNVMLMRERRYQVTCNLLEYFEQMVARLHQIQIQGRYKFAGKLKPQPVKLQLKLTELEDLIQSPSIKTQIIHTFGHNSPQSEMLNVILGKGQAITSALVRATPDTWPVIDKTIAKQLRETIEPMVHEMEQSLNESMRISSILKGAFTFHSLRKKESAGQELSDSPA